MICLFLQSEFCQMSRPDPSFSLTILALALISLLVDVIPIRNADSWSVAKAMRRVQDDMKRDERILGNGGFTQLVLNEAGEPLEERYRLLAQEYDLDKVTNRVSSLVG